MRDEIAVGGAPCSACGGFYGEHADDCPTKLAQEEAAREQSFIPRRFRVPASGQHPTGRGKYHYGCYFPMTDLVVSDMGWRGTGQPKEVEWLD